MTAALLGAGPPPVPTHKGLPGLAAIESASYRLFTRSNRDYPAAPGDTFVLTPR